MQKKCWVISNGAAGMENQAISLAHSMGYSLSDGSLDIQRIKLRTLWRIISPYFRPFKGLSYKNKLKAPWPELVIASGSQAILPALHVKSASKGSTKVIYLQNPRISPKHFDLVICPEHDQLKGENVISMIGAPFSIQIEKQKESLNIYADFLKTLPEPRLAIMIGGPNRTYKMSLQWAKRLLKQIHAFLNFGMGLMITTSRRTPKEVHDFLYNKLANSGSVFFWNNEGANPYHAFLVASDAILLTCDSVSMASEACGTNKPVYLIPLDGGNNTFKHFHNSLLDLGRVRWLSDDVLPTVYESEPFNQTSKIAKQAKNFLKLK